MHKISTEWGKNAVCIFIAHIKRFTKGVDALKILRVIINFACPSFHSALSEIKKLKVNELQ
jgi:hypothetical protein